MSRKSDCRNFLGISQLLMPCPLQLVATSPELQLLPSKTILQLNIGKKIAENSLNTFRFPGRELSELVLTCTI